MEASGKRYIVHPSRSDEFTIWNLSDWHLLNRACAREKLQKDIDAIRDDPGSFFFGGGDYCEYISPTDKRFDPSCCADELTARDFGRLGTVGKGLVRELLRPIRGKCLGLLQGNHETSYQKQKEQQSLHEELCRELDVPDLEYSALVDLVFTRLCRVKQPKLQPNAPPDFNRGGETFRFYLHHGAGAACTPAGKLNRLIQFMEMFEADVFMVGHVHDKKGQRLEIIGANAHCTELVSRTKVGVIAGSYLKTYAQGVTTYGEQRGYRPTTLGAAYVHIKPQGRIVRAEI